MTKKLTIQLENSLKKYKETYRLLEEYDKKAVTETEILANSGRLRKSISKQQGSSGSGRVNTSI